MLNFRCHGVDKKGNKCENLVGLFHYFFGSALCIDCEIELLQLRMGERCCFVVIELRTTISDGNALLIS